METKKVYNRLNIKSVFTSQKYHVTAQDNDVKQMESSWDIMD